MMMNRDRLGFWTRLVAIVLSVFFVGSFIFLGIGGNVSYNLFEIWGGGDQQQAAQTTGPEDQIRAAEKELEENPDDPDAVRGLAAAYFQAGRYDDAEKVLQDGREKAKNDEEIRLFLGQVHEQQALVASDKQKKELYVKAGDAYAEAAEIEPKNEDAFLLAGQAYDQAGRKSEAIKYWNGYLELEPEGQEAKAVKERISALLSGEDTTGAAGGSPER